MFPFDEAIAHLRTRLADPLPGRAAQFTMAPAPRRDASLATVEGKACREAGVLIPLFPYDGQPVLILTVRHGHLKQHAGQVSFPGGRREPDEDLVDTALREAHEEVDIRPETIEVLGSLTPLYIPPSNFCVYPFIGTAPDFPVLRLQDAEVSAILRVPLAYLLDPNTRTREAWTLRGKEMEVPFFALEGHKVWGATAMLLAEFAALFSSADAPA